MTTEITIKDGWLEDASGNRNSTAYWGNEAKAREALESLKDCDNCTNCSDCSRCSRCSRCSCCSDCSDCSRCSRCSRCSCCSDCSRCSDCSCCSRCSRCSRCSHVAWLCDKKNLQGDPDAEPGQSGPPPTPAIENIHQSVFEAVTQPANALEMGSWHQCNTTHCRAGWVVHLAGEAGYALERFFDTPLAAMKIYEASGYEINPCRFFDSNEDAMADMKRLAEAGTGEAS